MYKIFVVMIVSLTLVNCEYKKFQYSDCGSKEVVWNNLDVTPMPIVQPGNIRLLLDLLLKRDLVGDLQVILDIKRTVSGLTLPIRCYKVTSNGKPVDVGSCKYPDLCTVVRNLLPKFNKENCPSKLLEYGIDCTCPFKLKGNAIQIDQEFEVPDAELTVANWLASGDFDVRLTTSDSKGEIACVKINFSVTSK